MYVCMYVIHTMYVFICVYMHMYIRTLSASMAACKNTYSQIVRSDSYTIYNITIYQR